MHTTGYQHRLVSGGVHIGVMRAQFAAIPGGILGDAPVDGAVAIVHTEGVLFPRGQSRGLRGTERCVKVLVVCEIEILGEPLQPQIVCLFGTEEEATGLCSVPSPPFLAGLLLLHTYCTAISQHTACMPRALTTSTRKSKKRTYPLEIHPRFPAPMYQLAQRHTRAKVVQ